MHQAVSVCKQNISIAVVPLLVLCLVLSTESLVYVLLYQSLQMLVCVCVFVAQLSKWTGLIL